MNTRKIKLCLATLACASLFTAVVGFVIKDSYVRVEGDSMEPTYHSGQLLSVTKATSSQFELPKDYPVCVVKNPDGVHVLKRLIGYPGDTVQLVEGDTYVNGCLVMLRSTQSYDTMEWTLGEDEYFFLGDNRLTSIDSRRWIPPVLPKESIIAVVNNSSLPGVSA